MTSIIIPAHNEEQVIGRCLDAILADAETDEFEIVVVTNGCTDRTDEIARSRGVTVVDSPVASKPAALNLGDETAVGFPRMYVDADVEVSAAAIRAVATLLETTPAQIAAPEYRVDLSDRPWTIRAYYDVWTSLPYITDDLVGSGFYGLSAEARSRFEDFPDTMAEDFFIRSLAGPGERRSAKGHHFLAHPPLDLASLVKIRTRIFAANVRNKELFSSSADELRDGHKDTLLALAKDPRKWGGLAVYLGVATVSKYKAEQRNKSGKTDVWDRDATARAKAAGAQQ